MNYDVAEIKIHYNLTGKRAEINLTRILDRADGNGRWSSSDNRSAL